MTIFFEKLMALPLYSSTVSFSLKVGCFSLLQRSRHKKTPIIYVLFLVYVYFFLHLLLCFLMTALQVYFSARRLCGQ